MYFLPYINTVLGQDSMLGVTTVQGSSPWGGGFSAPVWTDPGAHPASYTKGTGSSLGLKWLRRGVKTTSSAKVKARVKQLFFFPSFLSILCTEKLTVLILN
jgi:hypothetical protein